MLKYATLLLVLVYFGESKVSPIRFTSHPEVMDKLWNDCGKKRCMRFEDLLYNLEENGGGRVMKEYNVCIFRSLGVLNKDNQIDQGIAKKLVETFFPEDTEKILKECFGKRICDLLNDIYETSVCAIRNANQL
uniref:Uncharacterized protein LOC114332635 n=1 Tax=Diabrotica virgifera virgifera TaxID=50390 RepID=A0A6P7G0S3_DIAVI